MRPADFPWVLRQRVTVPDPVAGYVDRPGVVERAMPTRRRLTVLKAAGGFGKTVLLAECCRRLRTDGVATAFLALDALDTPDTLDTYVAAACAAAGLEARALPTGDEAERPAPRTATMLRLIQSLGRPFVIALDEVEQLSDPSCVSIVDFMLRRGPSNLHVALAGRELPAGLDVAGPALEGRAEILGTEDLRFAAPDVARFFDFRLSRRALAREAARTAGWPFALRVARNGTDTRTVPSDDPDDLAGNWIETRLFARLDRDDRDLALDLGLFDWIDEGLLGEVMRSGEVARRARSLPVLEGLLEPVESGPVASWRLHPLLRRHCAGQRFREDPERFRSVHRRIARALAGRHDTVAAMRHAATADDPFLAGTLFERAGGVRLWLREGVARYREANALLQDDVVAASTRLKLARCIALTLAGRHHEARALHAECSPGDAGDTGGDRFGEDEAARRFEIFVDDRVVRSGMGLYGGTLLGAGADRLFEQSNELRRSPRVDASTRGQLNCALSVMHFLRGAFEPALERLAAARELVFGSRYLEFYGELLHGQIDLVRGRAREAGARFETARRKAREHLLLDPVATLSSEVTRRELALECDPAAVAEPAGLRRILREEGVPFSLLATATAVFTATGLLSGRKDEVLETTGKLLIRFRSAGMGVFARLLAAHHVSALVDADRTEEAERTWRREELPEEAASCVDLEAGTQTWREAECVTDARARLLIATRRFDEARRLLRDFHAAAEAPSFRRLQLRALALAVRLEQEAGQPEAAARHVARYVRLFAGSPYAWPLVRERTSCMEPVRAFAATAGSQDARIAESLLAAMGRAANRAAVSVSDRERQILRLLPGNPVKSMAAELGLSVHGVRYHLRGLFAKLGASNREELLRRARELGFVSDAS